VREIEDNGVGVDDVRIGEFINTLTKVSEFDGEPATAAR
jgi:hypothetical protein